MLTPIYTAIKAQISASDSEGSIKGIEWYNVQYDSTIANTPRVFFEVPEKIDFSQKSKGKRSAPITIRLHVVTQAITSADGSIDDTVPEEHEVTAKLVKNSIEAFKPLDGTEVLTSTLHLSGWQHFHKHKGWMVTFVEFSGQIAL
jgi:hypothetical protein